MGGGARSRLDQAAWAGEMSGWLLVAVIDDPADAEPRLFTGEAAAFERAREAGFRIVLATALSAPALACQLEGAGCERLLAGTDIISYRMDALPRERRADAVAQLARICRAREATLAQTAVVASTVRELPLVLEAGVAFALPGSGRDCMAAANLVLPPREAGGLIQAVDRAIARPRVLQTGAGSSPDRLRRPC